MMTRTISFSTSCRAIPRWLRMKLRLACFVLNIIWRPLAHKVEIFLQRSIPALRCFVGESLHQIRASIEEVVGRLNEPSSISALAVYHAAMAETMQPADISLAVEPGIVALARGTFSSPVFYNTGLCRFRIGESGGAMFFSPIDLHHASHLSRREEEAEARPFP
jgi:hypothetical protein